MLCVLCNLLRAETHFLIADVPGLARMKIQPTRYSEPLH
jgi:hypothetical protein